MYKVKTLCLLTFLCFFCACTGFERGCSNNVAQSFGADHVVVKLRYDGTPYRCWILNDVSITNEETSDGIYWKNQAGHLVHVSGSYDYITVGNGKYETALAAFNLTRETCSAIQDMRYTLPE
jgi:hypothetical protein